MKQVDKISIQELEVMAQNMFGLLVKAVVDVDKRLVMIDAPMHFDLEQEMLTCGSAQGDLWGINLHPDKINTEGFVEFDSMINIRPRVQNFTRGVDDPTIRQTIIDIITEKMT